MDYKTIVVHVDNSAHAATRIRHAARIAAGTGAHLIGSAFSGISRYVEAGGDTALGAVLEHAAAGKQGAEQALAQFDAIAQAEGVLSFERRYENDEPAGGLALQARYADLLVTSQTDLDDPAVAHLAGPVPAQLLIEAARPVLIIPHAGQFTALARRILVAWDSSIEATRAVFFALPLMRRAADVSIVLFKPEQAVGRDPGADLALYLARHGVRVDVHADPAPIHAGSGLLSRATDWQADLIVMGAYGHSRLRETMLGGVTDTVLASMPVPVLMAH